ncbi:MAG: electron transfer flavoprotein subunit beta [Candidatus Competibacteraceae bacterium]|nr:electron transfer flavoprotein subunit beta [Candidatus Competibacteraceae bacterium]
MALEIAVLVSVGRHPATDRPRRAVNDSRALELALRLAESRGGRVHLIHAGDPHEPALRDYLGMGVAAMTVLEVAEGHDVVPALVEHLKQLKPQLVLTGLRAEHGVAGGLLPYVLAAGLEYPVAAGIVAVELEGEGARLAQALPRGKRRALGLPLPLVATVDQAGPTPRQSAYARGRRGRIQRVEAAPVPVAEAGWEERPARKRPKRLKLLAGATAAERLNAAKSMQAGKGKLLVDPPPEEAAQAIYDYLVEEGILKL